MSRKPDEVRLCAIGLLNLSDDEGYFLADASLIRSSLWPFDEDSTRARRCLDQLSECLYVELKEHPSHGQIGLVVNFTKHQRVDRPRASTLKAYFLDNNSTIIRRSFAAGMEWNGMEQGMEGKGVQGKTKIEKKTNKKLLTSEEIISKLSADPTYSGLDVRREFGKMTAWCQARRKQPTERRFVNWLNNAEQAIVGSGGSKGVNHVLINAENWVKQEDHAAKVKAERERMAIKSAELDQKIKELEEMP